MIGTPSTLVHGVSKTGIPALPFETPPALSPLRGWKYGSGSAGPGVHTPGYAPVPLRGMRSRRRFLWNKIQRNSYRRQTPILRRPGVGLSRANSPGLASGYSFARACLENAPWSVPWALECNSAPPRTRWQPVRLTTASRYRTRSSNPVCAVRFLRHGRAKECRRRLNDKILLFRADFRLNRRTTPSNVATDSFCSAVPQRG
jgi:hypothetical protein